MGATFAKGYHYEKELTYGSPFVILASVMFFIIMIRVNDGNFQPSDRRKRIIDLFATVRLAYI